MAEEQEKSAYIEVLDYNRIVSFRDNQSLKEAIRNDLKEDLKREGFQFSGGSRILPRGVLTKRVRVRARKF